MIVTNTSIAKNKTTIADRLNSDLFRGEIARVLPRHLTPERMVRIALTAIRRTPKLQQCSQDSFFKAMLDLSAWGLEPDGRRAHLIPYGNECQLIIDYKGLVELAMRSGQIATIHADVVCENDDFDFNIGRITRHRIEFRMDRGEVYAAYCIVRFKDGAEKCEVMSRIEIEAIRKRSKAGKSGPWVTDWNEMAKKTVFRRCSKWLPLNAEIRDAFDRDDDVLLTQASKSQAVATAGDVMASLEYDEPDDPIDSSPTEPAHWEVVLGECELIITSDSGADEIKAAFERVEVCDGMPVAEVRRLGTIMNERLRGMQ